MVHSAIVRETESPLKKRIRGLVVETSGGVIKWPARGKKCGRARDNECLRLGASVWVNMDLEHGKS